MALDTGLLNSWKKIDQGLKTGNQQFVWQGNTELISYEQNVLLQNGVYDPHRHLWRALSQHPIVPLKSPIPGDNTDFIKYMKKNFPGVAHDVGDPAQRWSWIGNSMLPQYQALIPK
jgi:hypothetical protein